MGSRTVWIVVIVAAVLVGVALVCCVALGSAWYLSTRPTVEGPQSQEYVSNGQTIYFTGRNQRGQRIPFEDAPMWLSTHGGSCASCHGADGQGGAPVMMGTEIPGDIRYHHLTEEEHEEGEEHPPYTDELIKRAITLGLDPAGEPLDLTMPRWRMSDQDLDDLIEFLKMLNGDH
ncbi:MAG TPA: cytochrome c [Anaerolineae bacterium]|nr:cytochrome c [Anaerolineae bacterium]